MNMVTIPSGTFTMGSPQSELRRDMNEGPTRQVAINYRFEIGKYEVTFNDWNNCVSGGGRAAVPRRHSRRGQEFLLAKPILMESTRMVKAQKRALIAEKHFQSAVSNPMLTAFTISTGMFTSGWRIVGLLTIRARHQMGACEKTGTVNFELCGADLG